MKSSRVCKQSAADALTSTGGRGKLNTGKFFVLKNSVREKVRHGTQKRREKLRHTFPWRRARPKVGSQACRFLDGGKDIKYIIATRLYLQTQIIVGASKKKKTTQVRRFLDSLQTSTTEHPPHPGITVWQRVQSLNLMSRKKYGGKLRHNWAY